MNWKTLASHSRYQTAVAIQRALQQQDWTALEIGIEELIASLGKSEERALRSQLIRLMMHVIKWNIQPQRRSRSWLLTISNARLEIAEILEYEPHLQPKIAQLWDKCFQAAVELAETETGITATVASLDEHQVFKQKYSLENES